jgi:hypothetical protein
MDFHPRASKRSGAWMTEFRGQKVDRDGKNVIPIIQVVCNFTKPTADKPSLLNFDESETLFHEFGHALHGLLSKCHYPSLAGTNVPRDFVELPSQIMENWCRNPQVMKTYAKHYKTGEPIPDQLIAKIAAAQTYGQGFINTELLAASLLDMEYYSLLEKQHIDPNEFETSFLNSIGLIPEIIGRLPVLTYLNPLDRDALRRILIEPKNSIIKQYQKLFQMDGIELTFAEDALRLIVDKAVEYKLGARGLRSIVESIMMDAMFEVPSQQVKTSEVTLDYAQQQLDKSHLE